MLKKILLGLLLVFILGFVFVAGGLLSAHWQIRQIEPDIPSLAALDQALGVQGGPVSVRYINTATQRSPEGTIAHLGVLLEWPDSRSFLIDAGMSPAQAVAFGKPIEAILDADPTETFGSIDDQIGQAVQSIAGVGFTHLHNDHTGGIIGLCESQATPATVYQTPLQTQQLNYTTEPGEALIQASICPRNQLAAQTITAIPGFPGLVAIAVGGHTPGSTVYAARVAGVNWVFAGDIANDMNSLRDNIPKSWVYSSFIVPEHTPRLERLRQWLTALDAQEHYNVLVAHDIQAFASSAILGWGE